MIYIHIPYCRSFCTYCDFYSEVAPKCSTYEDFAKALSAEVRARKEEIAENLACRTGVNTLYIGGGTPSVLPLGVLESFLTTLESVGCRNSFSEFTVEVNPEDIVEKGHAYVEGLLKLGVNRISMGVQSFDDSILKWMNRRHDSARAVRAYSILEESGVENISIDLMFGLPQLSHAGWEESLEKAIGISRSGRLPRHVSSYQLSVEEGSALAVRMKKGDWKEASDEVCANQYDSLCRVLRDAGYHHYEISNFALPGYEAEHNSAYWRHLPYVGLGPGAHSCELISPDTSPEAGRFCFVRKWNKADLGAYLLAGKNGDFSSVFDGEELSDGQVVMERIMLGLRTSDGLPEEFLKACCDAEALTEALSCGNLVRVSGGSLRIPENRFFISDNIISSLV